MCCAVLQSLELKTAVLDPIAAWQAEYTHAKVGPQPPINLGRS